MLNRLLVVLFFAASLPGCASMGPPRVIYLARHGQTEWNRLARFQGDPDLDQVGYINRISLWLLLRDRPLDAIYTSTAQRTQRTAELLARQHNLVVQPRAAIDEIKSGIMTGVCMAQLDPRRAKPSEQACMVPARGSRPDITMNAVRAELRSVRQMRLGDRLPQGENYHDMVKRAAAFVEELQSGAHDREVLIVAHGVINRVLLHHLMGWPLEAVAYLRQENDQVYRLVTDDNGRVTELSLYTPGVGWRVCRDTPGPFHKALDCNPGPPAAPAAPPASQPASQRRR